MSRWRESTISSPCSWVFLSLSPSGSPVFWSSLPSSYCPWLQPCSSNRDSRGHCLSEFSSDSLIFSLGLYFPTFWTAPQVEPLPSWAWLPWWYLSSLIPSVNSKRITTTSRTGGLLSPGRAWYQLCLKTHWKVRQPHGCYGRPLKGAFFICPFLLPHP